MKAGPSLLERTLKRLINLVGKKSRHRLNRFLAHYSDIPLDPVFDPDDFDWTARLTDAWPDIRPRSRSGP